MSTVTASPQGMSNRRRRVRHRVRTPAYASFSGDSQSAMLELNEVLNISEDGIAIQCSMPLQTGRDVDLCLDLAEASGQIYTKSRVVWSNAAGRSGLRFSELPPSSMIRLREWLFLNAMSGVSYREPAAANVWNAVIEQPPALANYTDTLATLSAIEREVTAMGSDIEAVLRLVVARAQSLSKASAAAIALAADDPATMICRASIGSGAPPVGATLHVESGFSGECVRTAKLLCCHDTESDGRVNAELCRSLGVRSLLASPLTRGMKVIGLLEVFSTRPNGFVEPTCATVLQRLSAAIVGALDRKQVPKAPPPSPVPVKSPGSVLFSEQPLNPKSDQQNLAPEAVRLPRSHLPILIFAALTVLSALGLVFAPRIAHKLRSPRPLQESTVLASSQPPVSPISGADQLSISELRRRAEKGSASAQNALGVRYATGDGVVQDEREAAHWFTRAAEQGNPSAQFRLGSFYLSGRGVAKNLAQAYFWLVLARAGGDENGKALAPVASAHLSRDQTLEVEQQAELWLHRHQSSGDSAARP